MATIGQNIEDELALYKRYKVEGKIEVAKGLKSHWFLEQHQATKILEGMKEIDLTPLKAIE